MFFLDAGAGDPGRDVVEKKEKLIMRKYFAMALLAASVVFVLSQASFADEAASGDILKRLSDIEQNQTKILQSLEEVKSELQIVKVRVSSR